MDSRYAQRYRALHDRHWWWRSREVLVLEELRRLKPRAEGFGAILDVGCGDALFFDQLEELGEPEGVEPDAAIVSEESRRRWKFHLRPFDEHFEPDKRYGLILMLDVLEHLPDDLAALRRATELLTPSGLLVLTVPAFNLLWTSHDELNFHQKRYLRSSLLKLVGQAGLQAQHARYFFHWLFPVKLLVRTWEALRGSEAKPPRIPPAVVNRSFYFATHLEQRLLRRLPLPFGSSLFLVAGPAG